MSRYQAVLLALLVSTVSAQSLNSFRQCAQNCVVRIVGSSGCTSGDTTTNAQCLCNRVNLTRDSLVCLREHSDCTKDDVDATEKTVDDLCRTLGGVDNLQWNDSILTNTLINTLPTSSTTASSSTATGATATGIASSPAQTTPAGEAAGTSAAQPTSQSSGDDHSGRDIGIGVGVGLGVPLLILAGVAFWWFRRRKMRQSSPAELEGGGAVAGGAAAKGAKEDSLSDQPKYELDTKDEHEVMEMDAGKDAPEKAEMDGKNSLDKDPPVHEFPPEGMDSVKRFSFEEQQRAGDIGREDIVSPGGDTPVGDTPVSPTD